MDTAPLRRHGTFVALAAVLFLAAPSFALAGTGNVNFFLGAKILDDDEWAPLEDQGEIGVEVTFGGNDWPIHIAIDVFGSGTEETAWASRRATPRPR